LLRQPLPRVLDTWEAVSNHFVNAEEDRSHV
jgi:hypothetical protein